MLHVHPKQFLNGLLRERLLRSDLSIAEFNLYIPPVSQNEFRVLYIDPHNVPLGVVLIGPTIERNRQEQIRKIMSAAPSSLIHETGYVPNEPLPDYQYMIAVVERVRSIATHLHDQPAHLF